jgi:hypothetical protein
MENTVEQLALSVDTIQPDEAYLIYRVITETYDDWREEYPRDNDDMGWGSPKIKYCEHRTNEKLEGVVTNDHSYHIMLSRFDKFSKQIADQLTADNVESKRYENYEVTVEYDMRKIKHIMMKDTTHA